MKRHRIASMKLVAPPRVDAQASDCSGRYDRGHRVLCSSCVRARQALTARSYAQIFPEPSPVRFCFMFASHSRFTLEPIQIPSRTASCASKRP